MRIILHICCSNCAVYPVKTLREEGHSLIGLWFNPNIHPYEEYKLRLDSLRRLSDKWCIDMIHTEDYTPLDFFKMFNSANPEVLSEFIPPSPERCKSCYRLRLEKTAEEAHKQGFDGFSTTLLMSPYQDFTQIINIGKELADRYNVFFYPRDFRQHFRGAMSYASELGLYRQRYCGCIFSKEERDKKITNPKFQIPNKSQ